MSNPVNIPVRPRILFVDDEARILISLKAIFRSDHEVFTANSGAEAVELMRTQDFDVIVSDQRMPGMNGVEVLRAAREMRPRAIRLLLTGYSDLNAVIGSINEGEIFRFVSKPWSNNELRATIATAVRASTVEQVLLSNNSTETTAAPSDAAGRRVGVLIIDPDAGVTNALQKVLERDRPVHSAVSLEQGLDLLEEHHIGVIITELVVNGEVVTGMLSALRQHHPSLVTVVLTGQADASHSIDLINKGQVYRLLQKPVSEGVLRGTMNVASRRFEMLVQNPEQTKRLVVEEPPPAIERSSLLSRIKRMLLPATR